MKTIGLLGGMSWESTQVYYRELNRLANQYLGGLHSAPMVMFNVDFAPIEHLMANDCWDEISEILIDHCITIEKAGADVLVIATNTMHKLAEQIQANIKIPLLHIADTVAQDLIKHNKNKVGLLGTQFTMEQTFYRDRLQQRYNIEVMVPEANSRKLINNIIFEELCHGQFKTSSKQVYLKIIDELVQQGAEAIILGCTEIGLLVHQSDTEIPLFDATDSHINHAIQFALNQ